MKDAIDSDIKNIYITGTDAYGDPTLMKVPKGIRREQLLRLKKNWAFSISIAQNESRLIAEEIGLKRSVICTKLGHTNKTLSTLKMTLVETHEYVMAANKSLQYKFAIISEEINNINLLMSKLYNGSMEFRGRRDTSLDSISAFAAVGQTVLSFIK